jgi:hypothetical protein|tara:strand:+ start:17037 stop:17225 length:189 start_codon:yes stop_codon:yes gene_type:complete
MRIPRNEVVDFEEYKVIINYDGDGGINISVLDELGGEIEGLYISDAEDYDDEPQNGINLNLN